MSGARQAGQILYGSVDHADGSHTIRPLSATDENYLYVYNRSHGGVTTEEIILPEDRQACCGIMSPVRRTFCLLCLFDLLISFILWVIYTQIVGLPLPKALASEVLHYSIQHSLFDTVLLSAWRFVPLLLAYALFKSRKPWFVAITTAGTCGFLIAKVFLFDFSHHEDNIMSYLIVVVSFLLAWVETWFLDFKVLPREQKAREREAYYRTINERTPLLNSIEQDHTPNQHTNDQYYSPEVSDAEEDLDRASFHSLQSRSHSRSHSKSSATASLGEQEQEYQRRAREVWDATWGMLHEADGWRPEAGSDLVRGAVHSRAFPGIGKVYRLQGYIDCNPRAAFQEIILRIQDSPKWSPTVLDCKILLTIDDTTDIVYTVAAQAAGGIVSSRDFVSIRHWGSRDGILLSAGCGVEYPDAPKPHKHVRGVNGPCLWAFKPVPNNRRKCHLIQLLNTDLKGWIPQAVIDKALGGVLMQYLHDIRTHLAKVAHSKGAPA